MRQLKEFSVFKLLHGIEDAVVIIAVIAILIMTIVNVLMRYVFLSAIIWSDEFIGFGMLIIGLIGTATCVRDKLNTALDSLACKLPRRIQTFWYFAVNLVVLVLLVYIAVAGFKFLSTVGEQKSAMLKWPMAFFYGLIPVSCVLYIVETLIVIANDIRTGNCRFIPIEEQYQATPEKGR